MKIGLLQCGHTAPRVIARHGGYATMFERLLAGPGRSFRIWNVCDGAFPDSLTDADAWLMTGSPHGVYESHAFIPPLETLTRALVGAGKPLVGICFGHQLVAQALGGEVVKHPGGWCMGPTDYATEGAPNGRVCLHAWHQDQVVALPEGARRIMNAPGCALAGMEIGTNVLTLQAHPEFDDAILRDLIAARRGAPGYAGAPIAQAEAAIGRPIDRDWARARILGVLTLSEENQDAG